jgi:hypothetical protein
LLGALIERNAMEVLQEPSESSADRRCDDSRSMRRAGVVLVLVLLTSFAGCGGSGHGEPRELGRVRASGAAARLAPSGLIVRPDIADSLCNGGHGARLSGPYGSRQEEIITIKSGASTGGSVLIAFTDGYAGRNIAVLDSITSRCVWDRAFGVDGRATITIPSTLKPRRPQEPAGYPEGLAIEAVAVRHGGGAIIAGSYGGRWVIGEITARGQLDPSFARDGWSVLPFQGEVTSVIQEPSGRIIIGGNEHASGCCTVNWAAALSPSGQLKLGFGSHGRVELPTGESSGIQELTVEPNGDILVDVGYGNMGCWGTSIAMLTPTGKREPMFAQRLEHFWRDEGFHAFIGDSYVDGEGFTLVGTGQKPCYEVPLGSKAPATGLIARFRVDGTLADPAIRFHSPMYGSVQALPMGHDIVIAEQIYSGRGGIALTALRPDGSTDSRFASQGHAQIRAPWVEAITEPAFSIARSSPGQAVLIATRPEGDQLQLISVRITASN